MLGPGSTIGIVGGGQLGRMTALAARRMGYRIAILEPRAPCSAGAVAERHIAASYTDPEALAELARLSQVVTFEFENVSAGDLRALGSRVPVRPAPRILEICQDRIAEKTFLEQSGLPCAPWRPVRDRAGLDAAVEAIGAPAILKTARFGYDGKGQARIQEITTGALDAAWEATGGQPCVLEGFVDFTAEYSVIVARNPSGEIRTFPVGENIHRDGILDTTIAPARLAPDREAAAARLGHDLAEALQLEGLVAAELFLTRKGEWRVNELAPRPHNSGHHTFDACVTSQFEQHARAVCDAPLGDPALLSPAILINLLGDLWQAGEPAWAGLLRAHPNGKLHLYDKGEPRPGRKMGHFCLLGPNREALLDQAANVRERLGLPAMPA